MITLEKTVKESGKISILGVNVSRITMRVAVDKIAEWIEQKQQNYVCVTSVNGLLVSQKDETFRNILNSAGMVTTDGMPLVWLSRLKGYREAERVYGPDLMVEVCKLAEEKGYTNFFYGGAEGIPEKLRDSMCRRFPGLKITGTYSPPFRVLTEQKDNEIINMINEANPDILWLGISTPKQEKWMAKHTGRIHVPVMIGVGAAFDFHSGAKGQAPRWMQKSGLEWLFRLICEPRRLWRRYVLGNPFFLWLLCKEFFVENVLRSNSKRDFEG